MSFKRNLKNTSLLIFGLCLIIGGLIIFRLKSTSIEVVHPLNYPTSLNTLTKARVVKVIDGDTIIIDTGQHVRYIGMNTPEIETSECFATEASKINSDLVLGKDVQLEKDTSEIDKYGRLLRYVHLGSVFVNDELVKIGSARVMTIFPDVKYKDEFLRSQEYAKENNLGLWEKCL